MLKILAPHPNVPIPPMQQILCALRPTRVHPFWETLIAGAPIDELDLRQLAVIQQVMLWKSHKVYQRANPRNLDYMLIAVQAFLKEHAPNAGVHLLLDPAFRSTNVDDSCSWAERLFWSNGDQGLLGTDLTAELVTQDYDTVIMSYPDAIGLGWDRLETQLERLNAKTILVLNGRRRAFFWDSESCRALRFRRFVEKIWLPEALFIMLFIGAAIPLAIYDGLVRLGQRATNRRSTQSDS